MTIRSFDHAAIPAEDPDAMIDFYRALGFDVVGEDDWRAGRTPVFAFAFGDSKINVHSPQLWHDPAFTLRGPTAKPGCGDFCFVWDGGIESAVELLERVGAEIIEGPVDRIGGRGAGMATGRSVYTRDPDGNLLELISYPT